MLDSIEFFAKSIVAGLTAVIVMQDGNIFTPQKSPVKPDSTVSVEVDSTEAVGEYNRVMGEWCKKRISCSKVAEAVYFEARGDGVHGMHAVANVIMNRAKASGKTPYQVIVKPKQFSYLARKDLTINDHESYGAALRIAALAVTGKLADITDGSTHYVAPKRLASIPKWTKVMERTVVVLDHHFFRG